MFKFVVLTSLSPVTSPPLVPLLSFLSTERFFSSVYWTQGGSWLLFCPVYCSGEVRSSPNVGPRTLYCFVCMQQFDSIRMVASFFPLGYFLAPTVFRNTYLHIPVCARNQRFLRSCGRGPALSIGAVLLLPLLLGCVHRWLSL